jgi:hypothetical protein
MAMSEVTQDEMVSKYDIQLKKETVTGWLKEITLTDATGKVIELNLYWNDVDGYDATIKGSNKLPEMDRPEFEYILDCITEDLKFDRDNPWNMVDFAGTLHE